MRRPHVVTRGYQFEIFVRACTLLLGAVDLAAVIYISTHFKRTFGLSIGAVRRLYNNMMPWMSVADSIKAKLTGSQSSGSGGTYALNSGVIADISTTAERGKYMGAAQSGIMAHIVSLCPLLWSIC
jgi:MFS family permease